MGGDVTLVTNLEEAFDKELLEVLDVRSQEGELPRYVNTYDSHGNRTQFLLAEGSPLSILPLVPETDEFELVMIAPAFHEFRRAPLRFKEAVVGVSLQGPLRALTGRQRIIHHSHPFSVVEKFVRPGWIAFFSEEDVQAPDALGEFIASLGAVAVLTRGYNGATLFDSDGSSQHWDAFPADPVEPTGAGDCFAAAFMYRLAETEDLAAAMPYGLAAGALAVEARGLDGIASRKAIEARLKQEGA
jgi:hypothetical protein